MRTDDERRGIIEPPLQRTITVFNIATKELVAELELVDFDLAKFRSWFQPDADDEDENMVYCYELQAKDVEFVAGFLAERHEFDFARYTYFVEAWASEEDWAKYYSDASI
jgi:hypothetical protein